MKTKHQEVILKVAFFLLAFIMFPALTVAGSDPLVAADLIVLMEIEGFTNGIGTRSHPDEVLIDAVTHGMSQPYFPDTGAPNGPPLHKALHIVKPVDQISPFFPEWLFTEGPPADITFRFFKGTGRGALNYFTILLENPRVVSYDLEKGELMRAASETVSFVYSRITWTEEFSGESYIEVWGGGALE